jgi:hypothetical protein
MPLTSKESKAGSVIFRLFFISIETGAYRFLDMDFTVAAPFGALGWEPSPDLDRGESSTNLTVVR